MIIEWRKKKSQAQLDLEDISSFLSEYISDYGNSIDTHGPQTIPRKLVDIISKANYSAHEKHFKFRLRLECKFGSYRYEEIP